MAASTRLKMTFALTGGGTMDVSISAPKEGLGLAAVTAAAGDIQPVLESRAGEAASGFAGAVYIRTTEEALV